nr:hypothetical protein [Desulfobacterales bacterium]
MEKFLNPESVALIGVPSRTGVGAYNNLEMLLRFGYKGRIYPVNPKVKELCGLKCYSNVNEIPDVPELAVISVGRDRVMDVLLRCVEMKIRRFVIITQGFADADEQGRRLQKSFSELARARNVKIVGPNTIGIYNAFTGFTTAFVELKRPSQPPPVTVVTQTGVIHGAVDSFCEDGLGKAIDLGNMCDVDFVDVLEYLEHDPQTKVIALHMEGMKRGKEFVDIARRVSRRKPILVLKTGRSKLGAKAVLSHTGSLVGEDVLFDAAFERAGLLRVMDTMGFKDGIKALLHLPPMRGNRIAVITTTGAVGIMAADIAEELNLTFAKLPPSLPELILRGTPGWIQLNNPVDIWPIGMIRGKFMETYETTLRELVRSPDVDGVVGVAIATKSRIHADLDLVERVGRIQAESGYKKPVAFWLYMDDVARASKRFEGIRGVACFPSIERAIKALYFCYRYHILSSQAGPVTRGTRA